MAPASARKHCTVTTSGVDGACSAAVVLLKHEEAEIRVTSQRAVSWALAQLRTSAPLPAAVHVTGVGIGDNIDAVIEELAGLRQAGVAVTWYCGRGYLDVFRDRLAVVCAVAFEKAESNAEAVARRLKVARDQRLDLLLALAHEYALVQERRQVLQQKRDAPRGEDGDAESGLPTPTHRTDLRWPGGGPRIPDAHQAWHDIIAVANMRYLRFGEAEPFLRIIHKLAGEQILSSADLAEAERYRGAGRPTAAPIGSSAPVRKLRRQIDRVADLDEPVLVLGPSGAGKELVARALHEGSRRRSAMFLPLNCAFLSGDEKLAYASLFGHAAGATADATEDVAGAFEIASGGTLFLEEVAELPLGVQAQLLRAIEEQAIRRQGAQAWQRVDVRIIAASNRDLPLMVEEKRFREDLFYRLNVLSLEVPALKDRREDMRPIADAVLAELRLRGHPLVLTHDDWASIESFDWPGNLRQFSNALKRTALMGQPISEVVEAERRLSVPGAGGQGGEAAIALRLIMPSRVEDVRPAADVRRFHMQHVLRVCGGNWSLASRVLDVAPNTLRKWAGEE